MSNEDGLGEIIVRNRVIGEVAYGGIKLNTSTRTVRGWATRALTDPRRAVQGVYIRRVAVSNARMQRTKGFPRLP